MLTPVFRKAAAALACALAAGLIGGSAAQASTGDPLDRSQLGPAVFSEDFHSMPRLDSGCSDKHAKFVTQYCGEGPVNGQFPRTHGEHQCYSDSKFNGVNPFSLDPAGGLDINAARIPANVSCFGARYTSGMLSTYNSLQMRYGYWEVTAQMPKGGEGRWPALWLTHHPWPPEIDFAEFAQGVLNGSQHSETHKQPGIGSTAPQLGCFCDRPHTFGVLVRPDVIVWYADGREWYRNKPDEGVAGADYYLIINLAISGSPGGWTGDETPTSVPATLRVTDVHIYPLKTQ